VVEIQFCRKKPAAQLQLGIPRFLAPSGATG